MSEVLVRFTERVRDETGASHLAQASGAVASDGLWDGWIEFIGENDSAIRSPRETRQPNRDALVYWAEGLSAAYLEGALRRALDAIHHPPDRISSVEPGIFSDPAATERGPMASPHPRPVLDPFATYRQGEDVLRRQLSALSRNHLRTLIDTYDLQVNEGASAGESDLIDGIVRAVRPLSTAA